MLGFGMAGLRDLALMPVAVALVLALVLVSGQGRAILPRLRAPALLALALLVVLPLLAGDTVLARLGPLALHAEGLETAFVVALRLLCIVALVLALLAPLSPQDIVGALRGLGLPSLVADLAALTLRYLDETRGELARAHLARRLRGGRGGWRALPDQAQLVAMALIRAQARGARIWAAMRVRGHGALTAPPPPLTGAEKAALTLAAAMGAAMALAGAGVLA